MLFSCSLTREVPFAQFLTQPMASLLTLQITYVVGKKESVNCYFSSFGAVRFIQLYHALFTLWGNKVHVFHFHISAATTALTRALRKKCRGRFDICLEPLGRSCGRWTFNDGML